MFRDETCCDPAIDDQIGGYYSDLIAVSNNCGAYVTQTHMYLRYLFCYGCNPKETLYTDAGSSTITLCPDIVETVDPKQFDECGLCIPGARGDMCAGTTYVSIEHITVSAEIAVPFLLPFVHR
jgi:hypothetical protein